MEELKGKIKQAINKQDISYLNGVLQVERKQQGKESQQRIEWLENKIAELKQRRTRQ